MMKYLAHQWKFRFTLILLISIMLSVLLVQLDLTLWAEQINQQGFSHGVEEGKKMPSALKYILPFVKEIVLICVPMFITLLLMKFWASLKRKR
ncbi:hypothetical protein ACLKMH_19245 [Psychromonas sp. KJ10-10]|uniref:hypothetical protein n=1 Tax=Psychromonas sp. KJ10-10 TaxID=3391823 RepID=UPI0039B490C0